MSGQETRARREWDTLQWQLQVHVGRDRPQGGRWSAAIGYPPRGTEEAAWSDYDEFARFWLTRTVEHSEHYPCDSRDFTRVVKVALRCVEDMEVCQRG